MPEYIVIRYSSRAVNAAVQYYSKPEGYPKHYWSFSDRNAQIFPDLESAQSAQSWAYDDDLADLTIAIVCWAEQLRQPENKEIGTWAGLQYKAWELGCEVIY
jgi:hypothetical protein